MISDAPVVVKAVLHQVSMPVGNTSKAVVDTYPQVSATNHKLGLGWGGFMIRNW
jgi:hypothetical protein